MSESKPVTHFSDFQLPAEILQAVKDIGYETPTPIQSRTIPPLMLGKDLLGHAPTGTGKTAAFALPVLSRLNPATQGVQVLVLAPTRELAIQVAEAFSRYASHLKKLRVLPIYGGQDYTGQIRQLNRGVDIVVGTPGRVMDHMRRGTLKLNALQTLVLDEADEMLRMGFIDDVEWILEQIPQTHQMALFSATMPSVIRRIANKHLTDPEEITIEGRIATAETIRQRFWLVSGLHKLDALTRILEAETFDAMLVFVRTRTATTELAEKLGARGFAAAAMNGEMPQKQREQMVDKLKRGQLDILVATDVVARGLDVERISHVINYDIPYDTEAYVHRIGRTGRAGRNGDAILFVTQRERRLLGAIERATRQKIEPLKLPTIEMVNNKRIADFKQMISDTLAGGELSYLQRLTEEFSQDHDIPPERVAAALAKMYLGEQPLLLSDKPSRHSTKSAKEKTRPTTENRDSFQKRKPASKTTAVATRHDQTQHHLAVKSQRAPAQTTNERPRAEHSPKDSAMLQGHTKDDRPARPADHIDMERFRVEVGEQQGVKAANLVGAIANEAGIDAAFIGRITIKSDYSIVELPSGMPKFLLKDLKKVWVCNKQLAMSRWESENQASEGRSNRLQTSLVSEKPANITAGDNKKRFAATAESNPERHKKHKRKRKTPTGGLSTDSTVKKDRKPKQRHRNKKSKGKRTPAVKT